MSAGNGIGDGGAMELAKALMDENCKLQHLDLQWPPQASTAVLNAACMWGVHDAGNPIGNEVNLAIKEALLNIQRRLSQPLISEAGEADANAADEAEAGEADANAADDAEAGEPDDTAADEAEAGEADATAADEAEAGEADDTAADEAEAGEPDDNAADEPEAGEADATAADEAEAGEADANAADEAEAGEADANAADEAEAGEADANAADDAEAGEPDANAADEAEEGEPDDNAADEAEAGEPDANAADDAEVGEADFTAADEAEAGEADDTAADEAEAGKADDSAGEEIVAAPTGVSVGLAGDFGSMLPSLHTSTLWMGIAVSLSQAKGFARMADAGVLDELFSTSHVVDGIRCRRDFDPRMADCAEIPETKLNETQRKLKEEKPGTKFPHGLLGTEQDKSGLVEYFRACIATTGDRILWARYIADYDKETFRKCSTDAIFCLQKLTAVTPRPDVPPGLEECMDIAGLHWQILLAAAQFAFERAYNTPFANPSNKGDDQPMTFHEDHFQLHRPNHSLAHALRQTWYAPFILQHLRSSPLMDQAKWGAIGPRELLSAQLRLILEATGRQEDYKWSSVYTQNSFALRMEFVQLALPFIRTFRTSQYKHHYDSYIIPLAMDECALSTANAALEMVKRFLKCYLNWLGLPMEVVDERITTFSTSLGNDLLEACGVGQACLVQQLSSLDIVFQRLWTSGKKVNVAPKDAASYEQELCSLINNAIRSDAEEVIEVTAQLARNINKPLVTIPRQNGVPNKLPANLSDCSMDHSDSCYVCWRGGGFGREPLLREFFKEGKEYRAPMFLATSFKKRTALNFMRRCAEDTDAILWTVHVPDGCRNVSYLPQSNIQDENGVATEDEYLFVPYSAFKVLQGVTGFIKAGMGAMQRGIQHGSGI
ncbi:hypothetical protein CYMTET_21915 [Cymbomonas tetramitiformis]|uniref:SidE PDE domain-containing protein n=1 Tax=Cymbomonas tetramitiformis TaxID=36881 RepID=A0AAE0L2P0_9CHLO|nr:hypothetical protein CYMTET_21915 [Cymbomonas tetramitiformis]